MKLTDEDKKYLREMYDETEERYLKQIEDCSKKTVFMLINKEKDTSKRITEGEAIRLLGRETFVSGMHRAAFHRSATRYVPNTNENVYVAFSSYAFWR